MKWFRFPTRTIIISLYIISLISFYFAYLLKPLPVEIFRLSFDPLNVETNARVEQDNETINLENLQHMITISNIPPGLYDMRITFSGGVIVDANDNGLEPIRFVINQQSISISLSSIIETYDHYWLQLDSGSVSIVLDNFVKIEEQMYNVIISDITIRKHS